LLTKNYNINDLTVVILDREAQGPYKPVRKTGADSTDTGWGRVGGNGDSTAGNGIDVLMGIGGTGRVLARRRRCRRPMDGLSAK
jgi:fructose-1,6-bisphosphatase/sedoheptulose 1,7-bisphosphatase-like protein